jgi:hypothetical protein
LSNQTKTYKAEDWLIYTYRPEPGSFILDFSRLNGSDVLGSLEGFMFPIDAQISNIKLTEGSQISQGMICNIEPARLDAELIIEDFVQDDANKFLVGSEIQLVLINATPTDAIVRDNGTYFRTSKTLFFEGFIESFNVSVTPGVNFATISISAESKTSKDLNTLIGVEKNTTTPKDELIRAAGVGQWDGYTFDNYNFGVTDYEEKSLGDFLGDLLLCELGLAGDHVVNDGAGTTVDAFPGASEGAYIVSPNQRQFLNLTSSTNSSGIDAIDLTAEDISGMTLDWSGAGSPTGAAFTLYSDSEVTYNFGNSNSPGAFVYSANPDVRDIEQLQKMAKKLLGFNKRFAPVQITMETARTYQELEFQEIYRSCPVFDEAGTIPFYFYPYPVKLLKLLDHVDISNYPAGVLDVRMIVVGRTIEITPDNWITTYDLWKGYTY